MSALPILERPWLPRPTAADRVRLAERQLDPVELRRLAALGWDEPGLVRLARRLPAGAARQSVLILATAGAGGIAQPLVGAALRHGLALEVTAVDYEEPSSALFRLAHEKARFDAVVLWLDAGALGLSASVGDAAAEELTLGRAEARLDDLITRARALAGVVIPATIPPALDAPRTAFERKLPGSERRLVARANDLVAARGSFHWDLASLAEDVGLAALHSGRGALLTRSALHPRAVPLTVDRLAGVLAAAFGRQRKALVLDLDGTLWAGLIGEDGPGGVIATPGTARGDAHRAVQAYARRWQARGILLAVLSKNDPALAMQGIRETPGMVLREEDIALFDIGWGPKPERLAGIAQRLGLARDALVMVDDDPVQRAEMRARVPEAFVPELPPEPAEWPAWLEAASPFEQGSHTPEDARRTADVRAALGRASAAALAGDRDTFLRSLDARLSAGPIDATTLPRVAQMLARTNQFNLTGVRRDEPALAAFLARPDARGFVGRLTDRFGDAGAVTAILCRVEGTVWVIDTWVMSCRVLGRHVEEAMVAVVAETARAQGATSLTGVYVPSDRNGLVADLFSRLGFQQLAPGPPARFRLDLARWTPPRVPITVLKVDAGRS